LISDFKKLFFEDSLGNYLMGYLAIVNCRRDKIGWRRYIFDIMVMIWAEK